MLIFRSTSSGSASNTGPRLGIVKMISNLKRLELLERLARCRLQPPKDELAVLSDFELGRRVLFILTLATRSDATSEQIESAQHIASLLIDDVGLGTQLYDLLMAVLERQIRVEKYDTLGQF